MILRTRQILSLMRAVLLPGMPLFHSLLPAATPGRAPTAWSIILKLGVGTAALLGSYAAVSVSIIWFRLKSAPVSISI